MQGARRRGRPRSLRACSSGEWRSRSGSGLALELPQQPALRTRATPHASRRDRPGARHLRGAGGEGGGAGRRRRSGTASCGRSSCSSGSSAAGSGRSSTRPWRRSSPSRPTTRTVASGWGRSRRSSRPTSVWSTRRAPAEQGIAHAQESSFELFRIMITGVLGRLELALGNLEAAGGYLRELPERFLAGGVNDPTAPLWADAIETLIALGELEQARAYLEPYESNAQRLGSALAEPERPVAVVSSLPRRVTWRLGWRRSRPLWPTRRRFLSSAAGRCSGSARCAGRRSRSGRPGRRWSKRSRSSRS